MMDHRISDLQISRTVWSGVVAQCVKEGHFSRWQWTYRHQIVFEAYAKDALHGGGILHAEFEPLIVFPTMYDTQESLINNFESQAFIYDKTDCIVTMDI